MLGSRGGYTIVEVMVVLSVTAVLFIGSVFVFQGQQGKTVLSQNLYNLASQIQSYASQVNSGVYQSSQTSDCQIHASGAHINKPYLNNQVNGGGANCIFLGRAIQVTNTNVLEAYPVLGTRDVWSAGADSGVPVTSFDTANPEPTVDVNWSLNGFTANLLDQFLLPTGATFTKSAVTNQAGQSTAAGMVGIYLDVSGGNSTTAINVRGYNLPMTTAIKSSQLINCVEQVGACASYAANVKTWELCASYGGRTGSVSVSTTPTGITTSVNPGNCP